ncbi:MAG: TraR/DksA C4-type zinc finger protein [Paracoccaceae bacterium]|nr:TraR/DksA C4-type zinc finger protein [Paracoccaceae bacterium]
MEEIEVFRQRLTDELAELSSAESGGAEDRATVRLDQQAVGRLSRMDAMQRQAMAQATARRRAARADRIRAALERIEEGEFGFCSECGEEIAPKRLDLDPTIPTCVSCARG